MASYGFAFRGSSGYVTDGANDTYVLGETSAQTRNGITFNWSPTSGSFQAPSAQNRINSIDVRLAGLNYVSAGADGQFNIALPAPGTYDVRLAIGDANQGSTLLTQRVIIKDNGTTKLTVGPTDVANQSFMDAAGVVYTRANWPGSNSPISLTFATTVFTLELGTTTGTFGCLAYLLLTESAGGGGGASNAGRCALLGVGG